MEKYRLIPDTSKTDYEQSSFEPHHQHHRGPLYPSSEHKFPEVRITQQGKPRNYISYAMNLFVSICYCMVWCGSLREFSDGVVCVLVLPSLQSDGSMTIILKAMGRAINKAVTIAEILKRKMPLHQWNVLSSMEMIDVYEPVEEGLDVVESRRYVSCMTITLSMTLLPDPTMDTKHSGYQPPLPLSELQPRDFHPHQQQQQRHMVPTK
jgi:ribonucleases P/MRP protein subunit RPP25